MSSLPFAFFTVKSNRYSPFLAISRFITDLLLPIVVAILVCDFPCEIITEIVYLCAVVKRLIYVTGTNILERLLLLDAKKVAFTT